MKTRNVLIVALVAVLLVVYYLLGTDYLKERRESQGLVAQIADAAQTLAAIPPAPTDLEVRLTAARNSLEAAQGYFPQELNVTRIINTILKTAEETGVKAVPLTTQAAADENVNGVSYSVFRLTVAATGTFTQVSDFLNRLETGEPETLVVTNLTFERTGEPAGESTPAGETEVNASIDIAVYSRPGAD